MGKKLNARRKRRDSYENEFWDLMTLLFFSLINFVLGLLSDRSKKNARKKKSIFHAYPTILSVFISPPPKKKKTVLSVNVLAHYT